MRAKESLRAHWNSSIRHGKRLKSQHLKAMEGLTSAHVMAQANTQAIPASTPFALPSPKAPLCEVDLLPPLDELPTFNAINFRRGN